jgi:E3 ubiquitin-protein ligase RNF14
MELRRGKRNLEKMVAQWQEDEENKKWMEEKTMPCAGCGVRVERRYVDQFMPRRGS